MIFRLLLIFLIFLSPALLSAEEVKYTQYQNGAAEYAIDVPDDILYGQGESGNHMGQMFKSADMDAKLFTYGEGNADEKTIDDLYFDELNSEDKDEKVFTYKTMANDWFVVTGFHKDKVFYTKTILSKSTGMIKKFYFEYPKSKKSMYDEITVKMSKSFKEI